MINNNRSFTKDFRAPRSLKHAACFHFPNAIFLSLFPFFSFSFHRRKRTKRKEKINLFNKTEHIGCCAGGINWWICAIIYAFGVNFLRWLRRSPMKWSKSGRNFWKSFKIDPENAWKSNMWSKTFFQVNDSYWEFHYEFNCF